MHNKKKVIKLPRTTKDLFMTGYFVLLHNHYFIKFHLSNKTMCNENSFTILVNLKTKMD